MSNMLVLLILVKIRSYIIRAKSNGHESIKMKYNINVISALLFFISFLCPRIGRAGAYCLPLSFCLSAQTLHENLTFSHYSLTNLVTKLIFRMKAHLINMHLLVPRSKSSAKVKVEYQCYISRKNCRFGGITVSQTHLVLFSFF